MSDIKPNHLSLKGPQRLHNVVSCLSTSCPWTKSVTPHQMLGQLKSEMEELQEEMKLIEKSKRKIVTNNAEKVNDSNSMSKTALISEMGDILFDALMLEMTIRR